MWKMQQYRDMMQTDLCESAGIRSPTLVLMNKRFSSTTAVVGEICKVLMYLKIRKVFECKKRVIALGCI